MLQKTCKASDTQPGFAQNITGRKTLPLLGPSWGLLDDWEMHQSLFVRPPCTTHEDATCTQADEARRVSNAKADMSQDVTQVSSIEKQE